jgi:hypothetical protein
MPHRSTGSLTRVVLLAVGVLITATACSTSADPKTAVTKAELQPQSAFSTPVTTECPAAPKKPANGPAVPQAVCVEVKNTGSGNAAYAVQVQVQDKKDASKVYSQVLLNTAPIAPGQTGAAAAPAPGAERVVTKPTDDQKAAGAVSATSVRLNITQVTRVPS